MDYPQALLDFIDTEFSEANAARLDFVEYINKNRQGRKYLCLFGAGGVGGSMYHRLVNNGLRVDFFCDNDSNKVGTVVVGDVKCISFDALCTLKKDTFILISLGKCNEIEKQLFEHGFTYFLHIAPSVVIYYSKILMNIKKYEIRNKVEMLMPILHDEKSKNIAYAIIKNAVDVTNNISCTFDYDSIFDQDQYFINEIVRIANNTVFVDCGAFNGDTLLDCLRRGYAKNVDTYYCYELDKNNYIQLEKTIACLDDTVREKVVAYNYGVGREYKEIAYSATGSDTKMQSKGDFCGQIVPLASHLSDVPVSFIKMDIEGAEMEALEGASELIKKYKPTLAICVYHALEHLWEIPLYIKTLVPEYKIYLRHHTISMFETVCYAVIE